MKLFSRQQNKGKANPPRNSRQHPKRPCLSSREPGAHKTLLGNTVSFNKQNANCRESLHHQQINGVKTQLRQAAQFVGCQALRVDHDNNGRSLPSLAPLTVELWRLCQPSDLHPSTYNLFLGMLGSIWLAFNDCADSSRHLGKPAESRSPGPSLEDVVLGTLPECLETVRLTC